MAGPFVATLNTGSSSIKFAAYSPTGSEPGEPVLRGQVSGLPGLPKLSAHAPEAGIADRFLAAADISDTSPERIAPRLLAAIEAALGGSVSALGHRIVQGGPDISDSRTATPGLLDYLETLAPLAPDHQPHNLAGVRAMLAERPDLRQTLSFDTAFHRSQPRIAQLYALPRKLSDEGIIRYGYHGLSYAHLARRMAEIFPERARRRILALHLGSGASLCGILDGRSIACSMGFSAISGIPMSTRCGDLDPGALLYLMSERGLGAGEISEMLRKESGLFGVSGISGDLRQLEASTDPAAAEAIELFVYRIVREAGSLIAALGGLDGVIFTGGIGENSVPVRQGVIEGLVWAGVGAAAGVAVVPADEEAEIARGCLNAT